MLVKILLKIWFAIVPILIYIIWVFITTILVEKARKLAKKSAKEPKKDFIDGEYVIIDDKSKNSDFRSKISLSNKNFVISIYLGLVLLIFALISSVFLEKENHTQSTIEDLKERVKEE